jgi:uncharacterized protein (DUF934 family)
MQGNLPMPSLTKQKGAVFGAWKLLTLAGSESAETVGLPVGPLLVPVSVWQARRRELIEREYAHGWPLGVWLAAGESPKSISRDLEDFSVIGVHFPSATDGRGCFTARLLRERHGYRGELRAFGDVPREQLCFLRYSGFDAIGPRADAAEAAPNSAPHARGPGALPPARSETARAA